MRISASVHKARRRREKEIEELVSDNRFSPFSYANANSTPDFNGFFEYVQRYRKRICHKKDNRNQVSFFFHVFRIILFGLLWFGSVVVLWRWQPTIEFRWLSDDNERMYFVSPKLFFLFLSRHKAIVMKVLHFYSLSLVLNSSNEKWITSIAGWQSARGKTSRAHGYKMDFKKEKKKKEVQKPNCVPLTSLVYATGRPIKYV